MLERRNLPPLRLLSTFEAVHRTGSVQNAAAELNVTQPAVSQALKQLETHIGTALLDRRMRPAVLTEAGQILLLAVTDGLDQFGRAIDQINAMQTARDNVVTVACTICTGTYWLMPRLAAFYGRHPEISVRVVTSSARPEFAPETDLVIRYGDGNWCDGRAEMLFRERMLPVCSADFAAQFPEATLADAPLLQVDATDDNWPGWEHYFAATGIVPPEQSHRKFGNYVQATQAAVAGMGVLLGWVSNTGDLLKEGRLVVFRDEPVFTDNAFHMVLPGQKETKAATALLVAHLKDCAAPL